MADQVEEVKQKIDIVSLISEYVPLKKAGRNYRANCPFHSEKTPSFMVSPELQMYKCFGCGESGDAYSFLEKYEGMEFSEALRFLADRVGVKLTSFKPGEESEKERLYELNSLALKFYSYILLNHPKAKAALTYLLKDRGLKLETIKTFQLGYAPDVPEAIKKFLVDKKKYKTQELEKAGITVFAKGKTFDRFGGRIIFPLFDHRGNVVGFAGRILPFDRRIKEAAKYINSPETPIYHKSRVLYGLNLTKEEIKKQNRAIIVEGELDLISSYQAGIKNIVAIKGSALTDEQIRLLGRFTKVATLALDSDFAGDSAARRGIAIAQKEGLDLTVADLGEYKDPDEAARANPGFLKGALEKASGVWDFILSLIFSKADISTGDGKAKISREVVPVIASIPDRIVQAHYVKFVSSRLGVPEEAVNAQIENYLTEKEASEPKVATAQEKKNSPENKNRKQRLEERALTLAFQSNPQVLLENRISKLITTALPKRILEEYEKFSNKNKDFSPSEFANFLPSELVHAFAELTLADTQNLVEDEASLIREFDLIAHELEIIEMRHKLEELGFKIRQQEEKKELKKLKETQEKFGELSQKLSKLEEGGAGVILTEGN